MIRLLAGVAVGSLIVFVFLALTTSPTPKQHDLTELKKASNDLAVACYQQGIEYGRLKEVAAINERLGVHMSAEVKATLAKGPTEGCRP